MQRTLKTMALGLGLLGLLAPAHAGKKRKKAPKARAPISVNVHNACAADVKVAINDQVFAVAAGQPSGETPLPHADDKGYTLAMHGAKVVKLGLLGIEDGQSYTLRIADCRDGGADVYLDNTAALPKGISPHASAKVRFRAAQLNHQEYKAGSVRSFKPLSLGMTSYRDEPAGEFKVRMRLRAAKKGPVMAMINKTVKIESGRKYLIESNVVGQSIFIKREDEGFAAKDKN